MKPETLESLLLDRAFGELSTETRELLDDYLAAHPAAATRAAQLHGTVAAAHDAVRVGPERMAPARTATQPMVRGWGVRPELLRLAACVALGALLGWMAHGNLAPELERAVARAESTPAPLAAPLSPAAITGGIAPSAMPKPPLWRGISDHPRVARYRLRWDSPVDRPYFEEKP